MNPSIPPGRSAGSWLGHVREAGTQQSIAQYLRILWRGRLLIAGVTLLLIIATLIALKLMTPQYTATAKVMIDPRRTRIFDTREVVGQLPPQLVTVMSEVEVVRSRNVASRVADKLDAWNDPFFNPALRPPSTTWLSKLRTRIGDILSFGKSNEKVAPADAAEKAMQAVLNGLNGRLSVTPVQQSLVMQIGFTSPDPRKSMRIANTFAEQYVLDQLENKFETTRQAAKWLSSRLDSLREAVLASERAVSEYKAQNNLLDTRGAQPAQQQLSELNSQLILAQAKRAELEARISRIEAEIKAGDTNGIDQLVDSPLIQRIKEQETQLAREISDLSTKYRPQHPRMVKAMAEKDELHNKLLNEISKLTQGLRSELQITRGREAGLRDQIRKIEGTIRTQGQAGIKLNELERELASNRQIYEIFLQRSKETSEQEQAQQPEVRIISHAELPMAPSSPKRSLFLAAATLLGIIIGATLALLIEALRNTFINREQLEHYTGLATLGAVPLVPRGKDAADHLLKKPHSAFAESLRSAWVALKHSGRQQIPRVVVVTSSLPGEGKSVTALAMARTIAMLGNKVALVDCDLRRSSLAEKAGLTVTAHIGQMLHGKARAEDIAIRDKVQNLDIYPGQTLANPPLDLLASETMRGFVDGLRAKYDLVILDCPPVLPVSDAHVLARLADGVIFLVHWNRTPKDAVRSGLRMLDEVGAHVAGLMLTQVNARKQAHYGYGDSAGYHKYYKSYYSN